MQLPGSTHTDCPYTRIWGSVGSWGRSVTIVSNLYLLQLHVPVVAGDRGWCGGLMQQDQSVSLHLKANDRSDNHATQLWSELVQDKRCSKAFVSSSKANATEIKYLNQLFFLVPPSFSLPSLFSKAGSFHPLTFPPCLPHSFLLLGAPPFKPC